MLPKQTICIAGENYSVLDAKEYMTIPDCFVKENKIGRGNGEAKFYVGNSNEDTNRFFDNFNRKCFFTKSDLRKYLEDARAEYEQPHQDYANKSSLKARWEKHAAELAEFPDELISFDIFKADVAPPRIYINSHADVYTYLRAIALPQVSYLSALKLSDSAGNKFYYFRPFLDYFGGEVQLAIIAEKEKAIQERQGITPAKKEQLIQARQGQGKYREKLLEDCQFCPITLVNDERLLVASHIKPWVDSDDAEKTDHKNGFIFTPTYDKLFDRGFISFENDTTMRVSAWLSPINQSRLGIRDGKKVLKLPIVGREKYLEYHREFVFKK